MSTCGSARTHVFRPEKFCYRYVPSRRALPDDEPPIDCADLSGVTMRMIGRGSPKREAQREFISDALVIKRALQKEPGDTRYAFYLAQSWRDALGGVEGGSDHLSKRRSERTCAGQTWEVTPRRFTSRCVEIARCREKLGHLREFVEEAYRDAASVTVPSAPNPSTISPGGSV